LRLEPSHAGALATLALHGVVLAALLSYAPARSAILGVPPIMVDWIVPASATSKIEPPPRPAKPRPVKVVPKPVETPPVAVLPAEAPSQIVVPEPPSPPPAEPIAAAPALVAVTSPIFNADYLDNPSPAYPVLSRRMREEGRVVLRVLVNARGAADEVQISNSSGHVRLDDSARQTVKRWTFVPAKRGADAVPAWVLVPVSFQLEG